MRAVAAGAMAMLLLAGCGGGPEPDDTPTTPPVETSSATVDPAEIDVAGVCATLGDTWLAMAGDDVEYVVTDNPPQGFSTNTPACDIEPDGEYYDVAAEAGEFGRAEFDYGPYGPHVDRRIPEYDPLTVQRLLTLDVADPLRDELPCVDEPCSDAIHGYRYSFRFETVLDGLVVIAELDYFTTDRTGERQDAYRERAVSVFTASMDALTAAAG